MSQSSTAQSPEGQGGTQRLIIKACDMCRKKKIRCEPTGASCVQCIKYRTPCHFTPISVKRKPRRPPQQKRVEELEERLKNMEEQLRRANQNKEVVRVVDDREALEKLWEEGLSNFECRIALEGSRITEIRDTLTTLDPMSEHRFATSPDWQLITFSNISTRRVIKPLPSKIDAIMLVNDAFEGVNMAFPIFDQQSAMAMLSYPEGGHQDPSHWACLNVVLALAYRFRSMRTMNNTSDDREAWGYLQNALAVAPDITMLQPKLVSIQALLGMSIVIQGSPNPRPFATLVSQAIRMCHSLSMHRKNRDPSLTPREVEQRKRVFWTAYFIDKEHCLRTYQPPAQDDDEMDVEMPSEIFDNTIQFGDCPTINYFNFRVKLALIQGQVYKRLISIKAEKQSVTRRMVEVKRLEGMLAVWRASIPIDFGENYKVPGQGDRLISPIIHKVILRMTYFNTLNTIHRFSIPIEQWRSDIQRTVKDPSAKHAPPPPIVCVEEARNAIMLMHITPQGDYACIWVILHMFVSASSTLLEHILADPTNRRARSDLQLISPLLELLSALAKDGKNEEVMTMYRTCGEMFEKTSQIVQAANGPSGAARTEQRRLMGNQGEKESLEEFIRRIENVSAGYDEDVDEGMDSTTQDVQGGEAENYEIEFPYETASTTWMMAR